MNVIVTQDIEAKALLKDAAEQRTKHDFSPL